MFQVRKKALVNRQRESMIVVEGAMSRLIEQAEKRANQRYLEYDPDNRYWVAVN